MELVGPDAQAQPLADIRDDYFEHYYLPTAGPGGTTARGFKKVTYRNIYPSIDWVVYAKDGRVKYDFVVRPGGRVSDIRMKYSGATQLKLVKSGALVAVTPMG